MISPTIANNTTSNTTSNATTSNTTTSNNHTSSNPNTPYSNVRVRFDLDTPIVHDSIITEKQWAHPWHHLINHMFPIL